MTTVIAPTDEAFSTAARPGELRLCWSPRSPFVRRVMVVAHELDLAARITCIDTVVGMTGCHAQLMRINPLNKIPTLITDDGFVLSDTVLICEYLDSVAPLPRLFPQAHTARMRAMRWHALGHGLTDLLVLWRNERLRPAEQQHAPTIAAWHAKFTATLAALDREAGQLADAPPCIGQIAIACAVGYLDFRFPDLAWRDGVPALSAWFAQFEQRASMQATLPSGG
jgi:glutathione S-transferase